MKALPTLILLAAMTGCATRNPPRIVQEPPFYAPFTAVKQARTHANDALPASDGDLIILRGDKFAYGTTAPAAYAIYTYDAQNISIRHSGGTGYRYRWIVEGGVVWPPNP
ncbi:MAG TPA: hypothetical protein VHM90_10200 [Phycisphaerae bacterium]|nr:hypothetical protein [Phycisphaerae bacterium]